MKKILLSVLGLVSLGLASGTISQALAGETVTIRGSIVDLNNDFNGQEDVFVKGDIIKKPEAANAREAQSLASAGFSAEIEMNAPVKSCADAEIVVSADPGNFLPNSSARSEVYTVPTVLSVKCIKAN